MQSEWKNIETTNSRNSTKANESVWKYSHIPSVPDTMSDFRFSLGNFLSRLSRAEQNTHDPFRPARFESSVEKRKYVFICPKITNTGPKQNNSQEDNGARNYS